MRQQQFQIQALGVLACNGRQERMPVLVEMMVNFVTQCPEEGIASAKTGTRFFVVFVDNILYSVN
jgi:hypothetical protein